MERKSAGSGPDLELEAILEEYAPLGGPSAPPETAAPAGAESGDGRGGAAPGEPREAAGDKPPEKSPGRPSKLPVEPQQKGGKAPEREPETPGEKKPKRRLPIGRKKAPERPSEETPERGAGESPKKAAKKASEKAPEKAPEKGKWRFWRRRAPRREEGNVILLPRADDSPAGRIGRLMDRADEYAQQMFPSDAPPDPEDTRRQQLLPGVDWEEEPTHAPEPRKARRVRRPKPDLPPLKLAGEYKRGLAWLRTRTFFAFLAALPQLYLMLARDLGLPTPSALAANFNLRYWAAAVMLGVSALLGLDVLAHGLTSLLRLRPEGETLLLFAVAAALADALTMPTLGNRGYSMPYCGAVALGIFFALWGKFLKRRGLRLSCRVAGSAGEPYRVTLDEKLWNGADAYSKGPGDTAGYGSQIQEPDGAQRIYHRAAPILLLASAALSLLATVGCRRPELFFWCLSACLTAGCGFSGFLAFAMPFSTLTQRLMPVGAALGGWDGIRWSGQAKGVALTDQDLFPPGSVTLNGIRLCGELSMETAVSYAATLVQATGSGLEKPFRDLLHTQGGLYRKCSGVLFHEGGVTGVIGGRQVYVGSAAFMELMHVELPQGLKVKNAAFCAVDGELEAIFALHYKLHPAVKPAVEALLENGLGPILATRDFSVIPDMLRQKFQLPVDRMDFPNLDRRRELSGEGQPHAPELAAVLCREGVGPYAEAVIAGKRLVSATRAGVCFALIGAALGIGLSAYLASAQAFTSLSAGAMLTFLLLWLVPGALAAGWANRY